MNIYDYPKELNVALMCKKEGKTFEQYESAAQDHLQPIECQIFWILAEDVMDIVAEEVNKETAEISKMLGEKECEANKLKKRLDKMSGTLDISDHEDYEFKPIGQVCVSRDRVLPDDVITAKTYDEKSKTVSGKGLATKIEKSQTLGNWFVVLDLDTGSKKAYRLNNVQEYTELRYHISENTSKKFDPDKRVTPSATELCGYSDAHFNGEYHGDEPNPSNYGDNGGGF